MSALAASSLAAAEYVYQTLTGVVPAAWLPFLCPMAFACHREAVLPTLIAWKLGRSASGGAVIA
jgi:hypothetical protein